MKLLNHKITNRFFNSRKSPALILTLSFETKENKNILLELQKFLRILNQEIEFPDSKDLKINIKVVAQFCKLLYMLYAHYKLPIKEFPTIHQIKSPNSELKFQLIVYSYLPRGLIFLSNYLCQLVTNKKKEIYEEFIKNNKIIENKIDVANKISRMNKVFLSSAIKLDIPILRITDEIFQYGWGKHGFHLGSTFSEKTPRNSVILVRNKYITNQILKRAGFPIVDEAIIKDEKDCKKFIEKFNFPVVIKPADKDAGVGVTANITNYKELNKAIKICSKISKNMLIQRYVKESHFRMTIFNGKLVWTHLKKLASIVGDGRSSVSLLIKKENATRKRMYSSSISLIYSININEKTLSTLKKQGLTIKSIPKNNQIIKLAEETNSIAGATPFVISNSEVHPDNKSLMERAANLFRLDITGIDFFTSDIRKSWLETNSQILEINACPDLSPTGPHIYDLILKQSVKGDGRLSSALVMTDNHKAIDFRKLIEFCNNNNKKVGIFTNDEVKINDEIIQKRVKDYSQRIDILLMEKSIDFLVIVVENNINSFKYGLPIDKFDCICVDSFIPAIEGIRLNWLLKSFEFEICKNNKIKQRLILGKNTISKAYSDLSDYLISSFPQCENYHQKKFQPIYRPN